MLFNSWQFLLFFPIVTVLYFVLPYKCRNGFLLVASSVFYMYFIPKYILILVLLILVDYFAGILIESSTGKSRKLFLTVSLAANIGILCLFKYFNFFLENFHYQPLHIILPIGLSFHTFQSMSYTIEVFRGKQKAERNLLIYALYVMFYPQLVAGPIERPQHLLHQFYEKHRFDYSRIVNGLRLMLWGFFKKMVVADRLAIVVNQVYSNPRGHDGIQLILATLFFSYQIFCDFSGYSDIAVGSAQVMGFTIVNNFDRPYFSPSVSEFWRRWHISLSSWFRDYVYIPLGGNQVSFLRWCYNIGIVFLLSGFWHGANWTFIVWGVLHGSYVVIERILQDWRQKLWRPIQVTTTFGAVTFAWIFFRANTLSDAYYVITHLFSGVPILLTHFTPEAIRDTLRNTNLSRVDFLIPIVAVSFMECVHLIQAKGSVRKMFDVFPMTFRWAAYLILVLAIMNFGVTQKIPFIYFQF